MKEQQEFCSRSFVEFLEEFQKKNKESKDFMEPIWYLLQLLKPVLGIAFGYCFPKCFIPLKKGMENGNQKLVNKGAIHLMISIFSLLLLIFLFGRVG